MFPDEERNDKYLHIPPKTPAILQSHRYHHVMPSSSTAALVDAAFSSELIVFMPNWAQATGKLAAQLTNALTSTTPRLLLEKVDDVVVKSLVVCSLSISPDARCYQSDQPPCQSVSQSVAASPLADAN